MNQDQQLRFLLKRSRGFVEAIGNTTLLKEIDAALTATQQAAPSQGAVAQVYVSGEGETCVEFIVEDVENIPAGTLLYQSRLDSEKIVAWLNPIGGEVVSERTKAIDTDHFSNYSIPLSIALLEAQANGQEAMK